MTDISFPMRRAVSAVTAAVFFFTAAFDTVLPASQNTAFAAGELNLPAGDMLTSLRIPPELGRITEYHAAPASSEYPFILHIQDAHANPEAQHNIQRILETLEARAGSFTVGLEGALGPLHPEYLDFFSAFPAVNERVVQELVSQGELNGVDLFLWEKYKKESPAEKARVAGIEDPSLYRVNIETFRRLLASQSEIESSFRPLRAKLEVEASQGLRPELRGFLAERERRKEGRYGTGAEPSSSSPQLMAYVKYIKEQAAQELAVDLDHRFEQVRFPNIVRLLVLQRLERRIDPVKAQAEKKALLAALRARATDSGRRALLDAFENPQSSAVPVRRTAEEVWSFAASHRIPLDLYPDFWKSFAFSVLNSEIEIKALFREMRILEDWLIAHWARDDKERALIRKIENLDRLARLLRLEWTPEDFKEFEENRGELQAGAEIPENLRSYIEQAVDFYRTARSRDEAMLDNLLKAARPGERSAVLVSGGFHTDGLKALMRERGIGYAVIQPAITKPAGAGLYHKAMLGENADVSSYFSGEILTRQEALFFKALVETAPRALLENYGIPHSQIGKEIAKALSRHGVLSRIFTARAGEESGSSEVVFQGRGEILSEAGPAPAFDAQSVALEDALMDARLYQLLNPEAGRLYGEETRRMEELRLSLRFSPRRTTQISLSPARGRSELRSEYELVPAALRLSDYFPAGSGKDKIEQIILVSDNSGTLSWTYGDPIQGKILEYLTDFLTASGDFVVINSGDPMQELVNVAYRSVLDAKRGLESLHIIADGGSAKVGFTAEGQLRYAAKNQPWPRAQRFRYVRTLAEIFYEQLQKRQGPLEVMLEGVTDERIREIRDEFLARLDAVGPGEWGKEVPEKGLQRFDLLPPEIEEILGPVFVYDTGSKVTLDIIRRLKTAPLEFMAEAMEAAQRAFPEFTQNHEGYHAASGPGYVDLTQTTKAKAVAEILSGQVFSDPAFDPRKKTVIFVLGDSSNDLPTFDLELPAGIEAAVIPFFVSHDASYAGKLPDNAALSTLTHLEGAEELLRYARQIKGRTVEEAPELSILKWIKAGAGPELQAEEAAREEPNARIAEAYGRLSKKKRGQLETLRQAVTRLKAAGETPNVKTILEKGNTDLSRDQIYNFDTALLEDAGITLGERVMENTEKLIALRAVLIRKALQSLLSKKPAAEFGVKAIADRIAEQGGEEIRHDTLGKWLTQHAEEPRIKGLVAVLDAASRRPRIRAILASLPENKLSDKILRESLGLKPSAYSKWKADNHFNLAEYLREFPVTGEERIRVKETMPRLFGYVNAVAQGRLEEWEQRDKGEDAPVEPIPLGEIQAQAETPEFESEPVIEQPEEIAEEPAAEVVPEVEAAAEPVEAVEEPAEPVIPEAAEEPEPLVETSELESEPVIEPPEEIAEEPAAEADPEEEAAVEPVEAVEETAEAVIPETAEEPEPLVETPELENEPAIEPPEEIVEEPAAEVVPEVEAAAEPVESAAEPIPAEPAVKPEPARPSPPQLEFHSGSQKDYQEIREAIREFAEDENAEFPKIYILKDSGMTQIVGVTRYRESGGVYRLLLDTMDVVRSSVSAPFAWHRRRETPDGLSEDRLYIYSRQEGYPRPRAPKKPEEPRKKGRGSSSRFELRSGELPERLSREDLSFKLFSGIDQEDGLEGSLRPLNEEERIKFIDEWWDDFFEKYSSLNLEETDFLIAYYGDEPAAVFGFNVYPDLESPVDDNGIYVREKFRGKGAGGLVYERLLEHLKARGYQKLQIGSEYHSESHGIFKTEEAQKLHRALLRNLPDEAVEKVIYYADDGKLQGLTIDLQKYEAPGRSEMRFDDLKQLKERIAGFMDRVEAAPDQEARSGLAKEIVEFQNEVYGFWKARGVTEEIDRILQSLSDLRRRAELPGEAGPRTERTAGKDFTAAEEVQRLIEAAKAEWDAPPGTYGQYKLTPKQAQMKIFAELLEELRERGYFGNTALVFTENIKLDIFGDYKDFRESIRTKEDLESAVLRILEIHRKYERLIAEVNQRLASYPDAAEEFHIEGAAMDVMDDEENPMAWHPYGYLYLNLRHLMNPQNDIYGLSAVAHEAGHGLMDDHIDGISNLPEARELSANWAALRFITPQEMKEYMDMLLAAHVKYKGAGKVHPPVAAILLVLSEKSGIPLAQEEIAFRNAPADLVEGHRKLFDELEKNPPGFFSVRSELREEAGPARAKPESYLFPEKPAEASTRLTIREVEARIGTLTAGGEWPVARAEIAERYIEGIYPTAEAVSALTGLARDEALALIAAQALGFDTKARDTAAKVRQLAEEIFGTEIAEAFTGTHSRPPLLQAPRVLDIAELRDENNQQAIQSALALYEEDSFLFYVIPGSGEEAGALRREIEEIEVKILGGIPRRPGRKRLSILLSPQGGAQALRREMLKDVLSGRYGHVQPVIISHDGGDGFLQGFPEGLQNTAGHSLARIRLDRELTLGEALLLMPAVPLGQKVVDMLTVLEHKGYSRDTIHDRVSRFIQGYRKIVSAA